MSEQKSSSNTVLYTLIVLLFIVLGVQTFFLIRLFHKQNSDFEKKPGRILPAQASYLHTRPTQAIQQPVQRRQSAPFTQAVLDDNPWEEMDAMMNQMQGMMRHAFTFGSPLLQSMGGNQSFDYTPAIDLEETPEAYIVKSDLPGLQKDKINLTVRNGMLTIEGLREVSSEKKDDAAGFYAQERSYGSFARSLPLPGLVDESKVTAEYKDGVLVITLPKVKEAAAPQKVAVR